MKVSITLATRGRPDRVLRTLTEMVPNVRNPDTRIVVAVDSDDVGTLEILSSLEAFAPCVIVDVREREDCIGDKWARALTVAPADLYGICADYCPMATPGFDEKVLEAAAVFPDGIGVVCDYLANLSFPHTQFTTAKLVRLMGGRLYPSYFPYWFIDHWLDDISKMIGRLALADIVTARPFKSGTQDMREPGFWATFYDSLFPERARQALAIINSPEFEEPAWRKKMLVQNFALIEQRSRMINDYVRSLEGTCKTTDERYERIRARAVAKMQQIAVAA